MTDAPAPILVHDRVIVGLKAIGRRLGCSPRQASRVVDSGALEVFRLSQARNAVVRTTVSRIERFMRSGGGPG